MIKVSVFYPYTAGRKFDITYYVETHMPMVRRLVGSACKGMFVEYGLTGAAPDIPPVHVAIGSMLFESAEAFERAFGPHQAEIMGDVPNYTDIRPALQIAEVRMWQL
jgi:uncharacterized protein (TIGR02118 family)